GVGGVVGGRNEWSDVRDCAAFRMCRRRPLDGRGQGRGRRGSARAAAGYDEAERRHDGVAVPGLPQCLGAGRWRRWQGKVQEGPLHLQRSRRGERGARAQMKKWLVIPSQPRSKYRRSPRQTSTPEEDCREPEGRETPPGRGGRPNIE